MAILSLVTKALVILTQNDRLGQVFGCECAGGSGRGAWGCLMLSPAAVVERSGIIQATVAVVVVAAAAVGVVVVVG